MVSPDVVGNVVGIIGNVTSIGLFLLPVPTFWRILKKKDVEEFSPDPYLAVLLNCMLRVLYGLPIVRPSSMLVVTVNGIGLLIEAIYLIIFLLYSPNKKRLRILSLLGSEAAFMAAVVLAVLLGAPTHNMRSMIVGLLCVIFGSARYALPLAVVGRVIETKSVQYMPFFLSLAVFLNGACWTVYALIKFDICITILNGPGVLLSLAQLILYGIYYKSTPKKEENKKE